MELDLLKLVHSGEAVSHFFFPALWYAQLALKDEQARRLEDTKNRQASGGGLGVMDTSTTGETNKSNNNNPSSPSSPSQQQLLSSLVSVVIPDTILYTYSKPIAWFFTDAAPADSISGVGGGGGGSTSPAAAVGDSHTLPWDQSNSNAKWVVYKRSKKELCTSAIVDRFESIGSSRTGLRAVYYSASGTSSGGASGPGSGFNDSSASINNTAATAANNLTAQGYHHAYKNNTSAFTATTNRNNSRDSTGGSGTVGDDDEGNPLDEPYHITTQRQVGRDGLFKFLQQPKGKGFLQLVLDNKPESDGGLKNVCVNCHYTPTTFSVEKLTSRHDLLTDRLVPLQDRFSLSQSNGNCSSGPIMSPAVANQFLNLCKGLTQYFHYISGGQQKMLSISVTCKIVESSSGGRQLQGKKKKGNIVPTDAGTIVVLYCSSLKLSMNEKYPNKVFDLTPNGTSMISFDVPRNRVSAEGDGGNNSSSRRKLSQQQGKQGGGGSLSEGSWEELASTMIDGCGETATCPICRDVSLPIEAMPRVQKRWLLFSLALLDRAVAKQGGQRHAIGAATTTEDGLPEVTNGDVPASISMIHPEITVEQYLDRRTKKEWLSEQIYVCDDCILRCVAAATIEGEKRSQEQVKALKMKKRKSQQQQQNLASNTPYQLPPVSIGKRLDSSRGTSSRALTPIPDVSRIEHTPQSSHRSSMTPTPSTVVDINVGKGSSRNTTLLRLGGTGGGTGATSVQKTQSSAFGPLSISTTSTKAPGESKVGSGGKTQHSDYYAQFGHTNGNSSLNGSRISSVMTNSVNYKNKNTSSLSTSLRGKRSTRSSEDDDYDDGEDMSDYSLDVQGWWKTRSVKGRNLVGGSAKTTSDSKKTTSGGDPQTTQVSGGGGGRVSRQESSTVGAADSQQATNRRSVTTSPVPSSGASPSPSPSAQQQHKRITLAVKSDPNAADVYDTLTNPKKWTKVGFGAPDDSNFRVHVPKINKLYNTGSLTDQVDKEEEEGGQHHPLSIATLIQAMEVMEPMPRKRRGDPSQALMNFDCNGRGGGAQPVAPPNNSPRLPEHKN